MDGLVLVMALALTAVSCVPVDWKRDAEASLAQTSIMGGGLILLVSYIIVR
jgi:hypothetical protein